MSDTTNNNMIYLQPTPVRIWHWLNALGIVTLCITGAQIRYPEFINIFGSYKAAIRLHNTAGIVVSLSFSLWFFYYTMIAGTMAQLYFPKKEDLQTGILRQAFYYFFNYFRGKPSPHHPTPDNKFNPMQKSAYLAIMFVLVPLVSLTGIFLMNIAPLREVLIMLGGLKILVGMHFLLACSLCAFLFTHIYLATLGHTPFAHFVPMWTGWEKIEDHGSHEPLHDLPKPAEHAKG
ncbi:cytochrome b/b6 domain-containing protein [Geobacter sp. DSM 9736]|uniref:cytochrome b/b6 domain-containing protein n=1 Tax=Geobacter sp. DSM 9736 TaxID=1277350 RepID=UPI000B510C3E|nr:cytochrome b/b6 domain-containing protein [Geobacter sp. DSM 9736]SNB47605.1 Thiosulfate reductase cytochrome b subunit [Geobacter sp. DSM 9736]